MAKHCDGGELWPARKGQLKKGVACRPLHYWNVGPWSRLTVRWRRLPPQLETRRWPPPRGASFRFWGSVGEEARRTILAQCGRYVPRKDGLNSCDGLNISGIVHVLLAMVFVVGGAPCGCHGHRRAGLTQSPETADASLA